MASDVERIATTLAALGADDIAQVKISGRTDLAGHRVLWASELTAVAGTIAALALAFAENLLPVFGVDMVEEKRAPSLSLAVDLIGHRCSSC